MRTLQLNGLEYTASVRADPRPGWNLVNSIRELGQLNPITVLDRGNKPFLVIDGVRRCKALKMLGIETVQAVVTQEVSAAGLLASFKELLKIHENMFVCSRGRTLGFGQCDVCEGDSLDRDND